MFLWSSWIFSINSTMHSLKAATGPRRPTWIWLRLWARTLNSRSRRSKQEVDLKLWLYKNTWKISTGIKLDSKETSLLRSLDKRFRAPRKLATTDWKSWMMNKMRSELSWTSWLRSRALHSWSKIWETLCTSKKLIRINSWTPMALNWWHPFLWSLIRRESLNFKGHTTQSWLSITRMTRQTGKDVPRNWSDKKITPLKTRISLRLLLQRNWSSRENSTTSLATNLVLSQEATNTWGKKIQMAINFG